MKEFRNYRLDPVNQSLSRTGAGGSGEPITLPPKAFELLRYLVENPGRLVTHDELLETLWRNVHVQPEVIKGQILALRQALGDDARSPRFIETLRGRGYRFVAPVHNGAEGWGEGPVHTASALVGRAAPLAALQEWLGEAAAGRLQIVFVVGEPGIGKTALIEEFIARNFADSAMLVARGQCVEGFGGTEPYYPVLDALGRLCRSPVGDVVGKNLVSLAPTWAMQLPAHVPLDRRNLLRREIAGAGRERMLREICDLLEALSLARPLLLVFEDLHWADYSTVDLLSALARRHSRARLMIVASYRSGDGGANAHPIKEVSHALALRKLCHEIPLEPLSQTAVADFLSGGGATAAAPAFISMVRARSGGNPLFMTATLDHLAERGLIEPAGYGWRTRAALDEVELEVPVTLAQVIEARIRRLTEEQRIVLQAASVVGVSFTAAAAACATEGGPEAFEDVCEALCRQEDFIRREEATDSDPGPAMRNYSFRHSLYRQVFYDRQGHLRRTEAHRRIAVGLETSCPVERRGEIASELAQHFGAAEEWTKALTYLHMGLQTAKQRFANREILEILDRATALLVRLPRERRPAAEMVLLEPRAAVYMVEHDPRAEESYRRLAELAVENGDVNVEARALVALAYCISWRDRMLALAILDKALETGRRQTEASARARTQVGALAWRIWIGGWSEADAQQGEIARNQLLGGTDPVAAAWAPLEFSIVAVISTRYREAQAAVRTGYREMHLSAGGRPEFSLERAVWSYFLGFPLSLLLLGELGHALDAFDEGIALFSKSGNGYAVATLRLHRAWLLLYCGHFAAVADECAGIVLSFGREKPGAESKSLPPAEHRLALLLTGLAKAGLGANAEALATLSEVSRLMEAQPVIFDWYWRMPLELGLTNVSLAMGQRKQAHVHADRLIQCAMQTDDRTWQGLAWETAARVALSEADPERALRQIEKALSATDGFETPLADWPMFRTAAAIHDAMGDREGAYRYLAMAEAGKAKLAASLPGDSELRSSLDRL